MFLMPWFSVFVSCRDVSKYNRDFCECKRTLYFPDDASLVFGNSSSLVFVPLRTHLTLGFLNSVCSMRVFGIWISFHRD